MGTDHDVAQKKVSALTAAEPIVSRAKMHLYKCCHYITREDSYAAFIKDDFSNSRLLYAQEH